MDSEPQEKKDQKMSFQADAPAAFPLPGLGWFFRAMVWGLLGTAALWFPTQWLLKTVKEYQVFQSFSMDPFLAESTDSNNTWQPEAASKKIWSQDTPPATIKKSRPVVFRLLAPGAKKVFLGGTFNQFQAGNNPMTKRPDGVWETTVSLQPGRYTYKFKVDGVWSLDPTNPEKTTGAKLASVLELQ